MSLWSTGPTCIMTVIYGPDKSNFSEAHVEFPEEVPTLQNTGPTVEFTISLNIVNNAKPGSPPTQAGFMATLFVRQSGTWKQIDQLPIQGLSSFFINTAQPLANETHILTATRTPGQVLETYKIEAECAWPAILTATAGGRKGWSADSTASKTFTAILAMPQVGSLTLDYLPISIVYCPPNQDMTASLTNSQEYGTRMTIGESADFIALPITQDVNGLGITIAPTASTVSQDVQNRAEQSVEISYFRSTVLTADNQRAIGRAYWGPLADLFVLAKNSRFEVQQADGDPKFHYVNKGIEDLVVLPAYKLLRPGSDPVASLIPDDIRRHLLELDPFIINLDQFFPDSGADLSVATNQRADPRAHNRAELLGRWWLNNGTELNYSIGEKKELRTQEATEVKFLPTATVSGVDLSTIFGKAIPGTSNHIVTIGLQSSKETVSSVSRTAACFLMRNQNEKDLSGIAIYYDKIFSTLMFRRTVSGEQCVRGKVSYLSNEPLTKVDVFLTPQSIVPGPIPPGPGSKVDPSRSVQRNPFTSNAPPIKVDPSMVPRDPFTSYDPRLPSYITATDQDGFYHFCGLVAGAYILSVGDRIVNVEVPHESGNKGRDIEVNLDGVRRNLDLNRAAVWEVASAFRISAVAVRQLSKDLDRVFDVHDLAQACGLNEGQMKRILERVTLLWPVTRLATIAGISQREIGCLEHAGVSSAQHLWRESQESKRLAMMGKKARMPLRRLRELAEKAGDRRFSKTGGQALSPSTKSRKV